MYEVLGTFHAKRYNLKQFKTKNMTAVEWLMNELNLEGYDHTIQQAKEMEKQQIIDAHISGYDSSGESAKDYYDFYYGSKGSETKQ